MPSRIRPRVDLRLPVTGGKLNKALDEGSQRGWIITRMKEDWKTILPLEKPSIESHHENNPPLPQIADRFG
jgi:hypothetical protein